MPNTAWLFRAALGLSVGLTVAACDDFVTVENPNIVEAGGIDPATDGPLIAWSAFQNFVAAFGTMALNSAWFTTEAWTGDSGEGRSELGRRAIDPITGNGWAGFARGLATSEDAIDLLRDTEGAGQNIHLARVNLSAGYSYLIMAEIYCQGTARGGPALTTAQMLDLARERLTSARQIGQTNGTAPAVAIARAASVGLARALLYADRDSEVAQAVADVPADFEFLLNTADDPANRGRLGNAFYQVTADRAALVVGPSYRALADGGDTRIRYQDTGVRAYDGFLQMYAQRKYTGWASPYRLASGLEARYIAVEAAGDEAAMLAFVNQRRAAGGHAPVNLSGPALVTEFLAQKSIDFWLEGVRMGDFRRHGTLLPGVIPSGSEFYKPAAGPVGSDTCFPLPVEETSTNPNFR
jgi:hypothetical protein